MTKQLIQLIKNSNLVIVTGKICSGKSLLLTKLTHHPQLAGKTITSKRWSASSPAPANFFVGCLDNKEHDQLIKEIYEQEKLLEQHWTKIREKYNLKITTKGIKQYWWFGWKKYLQLEVYSPWGINKTINLPLTKQDLTRLDTYYWTIKDKEIPSTIPKSESK